MIKWNEITWYSKLGAIILFIAIVPSLTFYIGTQYEKTLVVLNQATTTSATAVGSSSVGGPTSTTGKGDSSGTDAPSQTIITQSDSGQTLTVYLGERILIELSGQYLWSNFSIDNPEVVNKLTVPVLPPDVQGIYLASAIGSATLTANGAPHCSAGEACPMFLLLFKVNISVVR